MEARLPHPAIVVAAWNRPQSLRRLLNCLQEGHYPAETKLHISIDHFGEWDDVFQLADGWVWPFGEKVVEQHSARLGLRQHMLYCGGLSARYGEIILLEDDLAVSPWMYDYAVQAIAYFDGDEMVAGISLYNYAVAESCHQPFQPWQDGLDNWFLQMPSSWGAAFTAAQWRAFTDWLAAHVQDLPTLPDYMQQWSAQSWKRLMAAYLLAQSKYFAYPRFSLSTNFEDFGAHANTKGLFQVPLLMGKRVWTFGPIADSLAVYDIHFEPLMENVKRICPSLSAYDFAVDLLGQKSKAFLDRPWVLTRRRGGEAKLGFAATAVPLELNLHLQSVGDTLRLVPANTTWSAPDPLELEFNYYTGAAKSAVLHLSDRRMPSISVVAPTAFYKDDDDLCLQNLLARAYLGKELIMVVDEDKVPPGVIQAHAQGLVRMISHSGAQWEGIQKGVAASTGQLVVIMQDGPYFHPDIFHRVAKIFHQFPGLDWLSGLPHNAAASSRSHSEEMARYRWDSARFAAADMAQVRAYLPTAAQVFRRELWMKAAQGASSLEAHFCAMSKIALPQMADLALAQALPNYTEGVASCWGAGAVNRSRSYYHRHIPLLWKWHRRLSDYRPVLRYDAAHDTWFEFDY
jgi:hypothetical protein